ncbi:hypothetical protein BKN38_05660 [Helicobacter sp. CLO-3]|uniref:tetratricopeptide repeat protein n=1 Tax=unclassified Helicobacter TaxID=2593540 RepID=UPI0008059872|nr:MULTISPECIES: tetratricopeptide repeat protein [unclassified Helicobacter]OBV29984.1 hypothetical protein BA723_03285 [Helicobacter sp. CLO-3]OHU83195.1 hypothetical protein BKN38_05660 [Helicobacter sp. CLO-3]
MTTKQTLQPATKHPNPRISRAFFALFFSALFALFFATILHADSSEDSALLMGADSLYHNDFNESFDHFLLLFDETKEPYYAKLAAQAAIGKGDLESAFRLALLYVELSGENDDVVINKILADAYAQNGNLANAIKALQKVYKLEHTPQVGEVLGNMYMLQKSPKKAQEIYQEIYDETKNVEILKKLVFAYAMQDANQKALDLLSKHLLEYGCEEPFCQESLKVYADLQGLDKAKAVFEKIYVKNPTIPNATNFIRVLVALKNFQEAQGVAQSFPFDKGLVLDLYVMQGDYEKARTQAAQIYKESKDPRFLALEAVYEFGNSKQIPRERAQKIATKLEKAIKERKSELSASGQKPNTQDAFFYNFCGYLMIDYDLGLKKGVEYVKEALDIEPDSLAYLDSLAWGYYKLGDCESALKVFALIPQNKINDDELRAHARQIGGVCGKRQK